MFTYWENSVNLKKVMKVQKETLKVIKSLSQKKNRHFHKMFVVEGEKSIKEFLNEKFKLKYLLKTKEDLFPSEGGLLITDKQLHQVSNLKSPNKTLAVFEMPVPNKIMFNGITIALDQLNDPGNLGAIIRLADWYDVEQILCSLDTVDCYNPKVVQASMGSLSRVKIFYTDLNSILKSTSTPVYGTFMSGENLYSSNFQKEAIIVFGNEGNGISNNIKSLIQHNISIPQYGLEKNTESLNVAMATAITISEVRRRFMS